VPEELQTIQQAYKFALDPTPRQARMLASHAGGARFAYNWGNARIIAALDAREAEKASGSEPTTQLPSHFDLCKAWTAFKDEHADDPEPPEGERRTSTAWVGENFVGTYQAALRDSAKAWSDFFDSLSGKRRGRKLGRPRFKRKGKSRDSFQVHGDSLRMAGAKKITLPKIGTVTIMSDDSLHPAMARSRRRAAAGKTRHMGNRRRSDHLWRHMRHGRENAAELTVLLRQARQDAGLSLAQAVAVLNAEADARAMAKAQALLATAEAGLGAADDADARKKASSRVQYARGKLKKLEQQNPGEKAPRTERWSNAKLTALEKTGVTADLEQASVICAAYELDGKTRQLVTELAAQAGITRATITLGADGLWWCSVGAEIPHYLRTGIDPHTGEKTPAPTPRQMGDGKCGQQSWQPRHAPGPDAAAVVGIDFGVREVATISNGVTIPNARYLQASLAELKAAQKRLSRCQPGSARREKARRRVALIHADIARQREAALHQATTILVRQHAVIAMEGWDVQQVMRDGSKDLPRKVRRNRNRALADTGVGMGRQFITYKAPRAAATALIADPGAETGRTCHIDRKARTTPLPPNEELFTSDQCSHVLDRRLNTALALAGWARQELSKRGPSPNGPAKPRGGDVRPGTVRRDGQSPVKRAASTRLDRAQTGIPGG